MTTNGMLHDEAYESLAALSLDALGDAERSRVLEHVRGCAACRSELASLERASEDLAYAVTPLPMSPAQRDRVRARLLARAAAGDSGGTSIGDARVAGLTRPAVPPPAARVANGARWMAMAASLIAVAGVGLLVRTSAELARARESLRVAAARQGERAIALDSLRAAVSDRDRMIANLTGPGVAVLTLASTDPRSPTGRMFWDQPHGTWVFVAHNLGRPKPGRAYQLWLVTATSKISAGTFVPGASGDAVVRATYPLRRNQLAAVAVTEEPEAGSAQPTSAPFLVATSGR